MVSPGNTFVCLTQPSPTLCKKDEPDVYFPSGNRNYVRVVPNDAVQGAGLASFAKEQGVKKPFVLIARDDPTSEGQGRTFAGAAAAAGMQVAGTEHCDPNAENYTALMEKVKAVGGRRGGAGGDPRAERRAADPRQGRRRSARTTGPSSCSPSTASPSRPRSTTPARTRRGCT